MTSRGTHEHVVIDARVSRRIGAGHLVRSLELARRLRARGKRVVFLPPGAGTLSRVLLQSFPVRTVSMMLASPALVLIDRPDAGPALFARHLRRWPTARIVVLDYYGDGDGALDAVINLNAGRENSRGRHGPRTAYRRGLEYAMLRESFIRLRRARHQTRPTAKRIGICFGGTDPSNWTGLALEALGPGLRRAGLRADVLIGRPSRAVRRAAEDLGDNIAEVHVALADPAVLLSKCDLLVTGGGTLMMEAACLGVPSVVVPRNFAERLFAREFESVGAAVVMKHSALFPAKAVASAASRLADDSPSRRRMSVAGRRLIDGKGADRVVALILSLIKRNP